MKEDSVDQCILNPAADRFKKQQLAFSFREKKSDRTPITAILFK